MAIIPVVMVVDRALRDAAIPIDGVSVGDPTDRSTWKAFYQASATAQQRAQGDALLLTIDPQDPAILAEIKQDFAIADATKDLIVSLAQALWEAIPVPTVTLAQLRARVIALYRAKL